VALVERLLVIERFACHFVFILPGVLLLFAALGEISNDQSPSGGLSLPGACYDNCASGSIPIRSFTAQRNFCVHPR
jgi:hypothetical protein